MFVEYQDVNRLIKQMSDKKFTCLKGTQPWSRQNSNNSKFSA